MLGDAIDKEGDLSFAAIDQIGWQLTDQCRAGIGFRKQEIGNEDQCRWQDCAKGQEIAVIIRLRMQACTNARSG